MRPEELGKFKNSPHRVSIPRPSGFRLRISKIVLAAKNINATMEELLDASTSMKTMPYERKAGN
jgi:hypothetical protein